MLFLKVLKMKKVFSRTYFFDLIESPREETGLSKQQKGQTSQSLRTL